MAVVVIGNSVIAGAMGGLLASHFNGSVTPSEYAVMANAAQAVKDEFLTVNTASGAAIADADNAQVGPLIAAITLGTLMQQGAASTVATDYLSIARQIYAATKQALTELA